MTTKTVGNLTITTPTDREIVMTRVFDAPRKLVWDAHTKPEIVKKWLGVFNGMTLPVCEIDLRVGGKARYEWRMADGQTMGMSMTFLEIVPLEKIVNTEEFDDAWYEGKAVGNLHFAGEHANSFYEWQGFMEGALLSGIAAAGEILDS